MNKIIELTDHNFEKKVLQSNTFVLVDFWAEWCNPCKMISIILDEIAQEYNEKIIVGKLNIENNPNTPPIYSIRSIPTLLLFSNQSVIATKVGAVSKIQLKDFLDKNIH
ncbi:thioredoxin TrxA [Buchnera aphidicola]|uniref:thioredoxin TrxA n=1 Tax=Buchnera aphidicola TaxID=9 RepID=UPI0034638632